MFTPEVRRLCRQHSLNFGVLVELRFKSRTMFVHNGGGVLTSRDQNEQIESTQWLGLQGLAKVGNLGQSRFGESRSVTAQINFQDEFIRESFNQQDREIRGQKFLFWGQHYDSDNQPKGAKFHIYTGIGDRLRMQKSGPSSRTITLMMEDKIARRRRSANSHITHADQQTRDPGSTGFTYVPEMIDKTLNIFDARS